MNKYTQNRIKHAFSHYEKNEKIQLNQEFSNFPIPIIPEKKAPFRAQTHAQNEYGFSKENIVNNNNFFNPPRTSINNLNASIFPNFSNILSNPNTPNNFGNQPIGPQLT